MPQTPLGGIIVDPQGQTVQVAITTPGGIVPVAYADRLGAATLPLPATISVPTTFYVGSGPYKVAAAGQTVVVGVEGGEIASVAVPVVDNPAGIELGRAETAVVYTLTTAMVAVPGLALPANVPAGRDVHIDCECPWVAMGATATYIALRIFEDAVQLKTSLTDIVASKNAPARVQTSYTPATSGYHTYTVQAQIGVASAGAAIEAGGIGGSLISPYLRAVSC